MIAKKEIKELSGLKQFFTDKDGKTIMLDKVLDKDDWWETTGKNKSIILKHKAVKKIADIAGVDRCYQNAILTQPSSTNNFQCTWQCIVQRTIGIKTEGAVGIGESNRSNLGSKGRGNPANMAEKRAYDRAVFALLGITGLLSEEELSDEEYNKEEKMEDLNHDERKQIAPVINNLLLATSEKHLIIFNKEMKETAKTLSDKQLDYLRKLYKKRVGELKKTSF